MDIILHRRMMSFRLLPGSSTRGSYFRLYATDILQGSEPNVGNQRIGYGL